jgi:antitoxin component of RelBE/YafQ-DinJ toxin-antitoxin module
MATTTAKIIFNIPTKLKLAAKKRAAKEGLTLTDILNHTLELYAENLFDPEDFLTKEDIVAIKEARAQVARGEVYTLAEVKEHLGMTSKTK